MRYTNRHLLTYLLTYRRLIGLIAFVAALRERARPVIGGLVGGREIVTIAAL